MSQPVILDSGPLGQISHADPSRNAEIKAWFDLLLARDIPVFIPAIVDFEVRRSLILAQRTRSLTRLDAIQVQAASTERIISYLSEDYGVPINVVFVRAFKNGADTFLVRS